MNSLGWVFIIVGIIIGVILVILLVVSGLRNEHNDNPSTPPPPPPVPVEPIPEAPIIVNPISVLESTPIAVPPVSTPSTQPELAWPIQLSPINSELEEATVCLSESCQPTQLELTELIPEVGLDTYPIIDACAYGNQTYFLDHNQVSIHITAQERINTIISARPLTMLVGNEFGIFGLSQGAVVMLLPETLRQGIWQWRRLTPVNLKVNWFQIFRDQSMWVQTNQIGIMYETYLTESTALINPNSNDAQVRSVESEIRERSRRGSVTNNPTRQVTLQTSKSNSYEFSLPLTQKRIYDSHRNRYVELDQGILAINNETYQQVVDFAWNGLQPVMLYRYQTALYSKLVTLNGEVARLLNHHGRPA